MKKMDFLWMWLFMLVAATGFVSCSEEDDEGGAGNVPKELLGSWNVYGTETITFNANGTLVWDYGDGDVENYSYFYDEKNETITISGYGESVKWKIISLTDSKLVLADDEGDEMTFTKVGAPDDEGDEGTPGPAYDTSEPVDLPELQYEDISGKYAVNESESGYAFVELTAAGQYFIVPTNSPYLKKAPKKKSQRKPFLAGGKADKRGLTDGELMAGDFVQQETNLFHLVGFGYLEVTQRDSDGNILSFILSDENQGTSIPLTVEKQPNIELKGNTAHLCRTWTVQEERAEGWIDGKLELDAIYNYLSDNLIVYVNSQGEDLTDPDDGVFDTGGDVTERVIFSRAGTYACFYRDGEWDISNWYWDDINAGILTWWDIWNGEYDEGQCQVVFFGNCAMVVEQYNEYVDDVLYTSRYTTILTLG